MSASRSSLLPGSDRAVLRWSENPNSPSREEPVDIVQAHPSETLIRSALQVTEETRVYLIKNGYTRIGIVKSCWKDRGLFLLEISTAPCESSGFSAKHPVDPGALAVDDFITEEEEAEILDGLSLTEPGAPLGFPPDQVQERTRVLNDLHHLRQAVSRSPGRGARVLRRPPVVEH